MMAAIFSISEASLSVFQNTNIRDYMLFFDEIQFFFRKIKLENRQKQMLFLAHPICKLPLQ
jgi:L-rhamnose mutarotase